MRSVKPSRKLKNSFARSVRERGLGMHRITCEKFVKATPETVFQVARDIQRYVEHMGNIESVKVIHDDGVTRITEWVAKLPMLERELHWLEKDVWDVTSLTCEFEMVEGDMDHYSGRWSFERHGDGTLMKLTISYEYQVPLIGQLLQKLIEKVVRDNADSILNAVKEASEK
jgi:ribosome-associated toxin RatA of RatAB toxin-antitoxin module